MNRFTLAVFGAAIVCAAPAYADEYYAVTPSGTTEMIFAGAPQEVIGQLSSKCIDARWTVISSSTTELVCEAPMNYGQSLMGTLLMGNSYSTPPRRFFRFNAATVAGVSRVQASGWMELQMAFGQMKRTDFSGPEFHNSVMIFMSNAGGHFPVGTTFPNHAYMGFEFSGTTFGKNSAMQITSVTPDQAAARGGLQAGDIITSVAQKKFKNNDDVLDAFAKAAKAPTYPIEIVRAGKPMVLTVQREFRPAYVEAVVAVAAPVLPAPTASPAALPKADELIKLAKLKADGVLSQAEFDAEKTKVLAR